MGAGMTNQDAIKKSIFDLFLELIPSLCVCGENECVCYERLTYTFDAVRVEKKRLFGLIRFWYQYYNIRIKVGDFEAIWPAEFLLIRMCKALGE